MKVLIKEASGEGLESLMGKKVLLMCASYFYTGLLVGVNETCVKLQDPAIVYDTGEWSKKQWADSQSMNMDHFYIQTSFIESFGESK